MRDSSQHVALNSKVRHHTYFSCLPNLILLNCSVIEGYLASFPWFWFQSSSSPFCSLLSSQPPRKVGFPISQSFPSSPLPLSRPCASPQLVFPGLFPSRVCECFPQLLFISHLALGITSPASGLNMLKNLRSLLIIAKSRWFEISSTQSFSTQSFLPSECCSHVSLRSSPFLSSPTQARSSQGLSSSVLLQLWLLRRPLWALL